MIPMTVAATPGGIAATMVIRPMSIRSTKGVIVVTSGNDCCDHILGAGETLHIRPKGLVAIRGLSPEAGAIVFGGRGGRRGRELEFRAA